jgi:hypothetical protein
MDCFILLIGELKVYSKKMSDWERKFLYSLDKQLLIKDRKLSIKQRHHLLRLQQRFLPKTPVVQKPAKKKSAKQQIMSTPGRKSAFNPPLGTIFYAGSVPPWE